MHLMIPVKTNGEVLHRGDLFYEKRKLFRVEHVGKPKNDKRYTVKFKLLAKINLDIYLRLDRA